VIKLDSDLVIEHVAPESKSRMVTSMHKVFVKELLDWGHQATTHQRELIVDKTCIQSSNKGSRDGRQEDETHNAVGIAFEALQDRVVDSRGKGLGKNR
jgi:hypothetical protein